MSDQEPNTAPQTLEVLTPPYKWLRDLYKGLATTNGCTHEFKYKQIPGKFEDSRQGGGYFQIVGGSDAAVAKVERLGEQIRGQIEAIVRKEFPGPHMYAKGAAARRQQLAEAVDFSKVKDGEDYKW